MAIKFTGTEYIQMANSSYLNPAYITFDSWVYIDSLPNAYNSVVSKEGGGQGYTLLIKPSGKLAVYVQGVGSYDGTGTYTLSTGQWYHLAFSYSGTHLIGYVNGNIDKDVSVVGTIVHSASFLYLASSNLAGRLLRGSITESGIWNRVLSLQEIQTLYRTGCRNKIQVAGYGLQAYWRLDEGGIKGAAISGINRIIDLTGHGNYGTPYNNPIGISDILSYPEGVV